MYITNSAKRYFIKKEATRMKIKEKTKNINLSDNALKNLEMFDDLLKEKGISLVYSQALDNSKSGANANAGVPGLIIANGEWMWQLAQCQSEADYDVFRATIGHELTHKEGDPFPLSFSLKRMKFILWCREIHADYGAAKTMLDGSVTRMVEVMKQKAHRRAKKSVDTFCHPCWTYRISCIQKGKYDYDLVKQIADRLNYKNEKVIQKISSFYDEIELFF